MAGHADRLAASAPGPAAAQREAALEARLAERNDALAEANRNLEVAHREMDAFTYSVAHDLRAPLRSASGFAQLLQMELAAGDTAGAPGHAARVVANIEKMSDLIDGLLAVARASRGKLARDHIELNEMLEAVLEEQQARQRARVSVAVLPAILADAAAMRQVWTHLLSNALKFSAGQARQEVAVDCVIGAREIVFSVRDNGIGIDQHFAPKLFGVFQRQHGAGEFPGTGVGLAVVRSIVERHGGRVWAESAAGAGADFHFSLPVALLARP